MPSVYQSVRNVLWNPVGRDPEELLLVQEGEETRIFVLSGRTGAALWSRLDGSRSVDDLARELADASGIALDPARDLIAPFLQELATEGLVEPAPSPGTASPSDPLPWPSDPEPPSLVPFSPDELAAPDLVAVGSYQGGYNNTGTGAFPCSTGQGGVNDVGGQYPCRPGDGNGFLNRGWFGVPCD
jgi:hypothetical protein